MLHSILPCHQSFPLFILPLTPPPLLGEEFSLPPPSLPLSLFLPPSHSSLPPSLLLSPAQLGKQQQQQHQQQHQQEPTSVTLFVYGLPHDLEEVHLNNLFRPYGQLLAARVVNDQSRGITYGE